MPVQGSSIGLARGVDDDALYALDDRNRIVLFIAANQRLFRFSPAPINDIDRRTDTGSGRRIGLSHDANEDIERVFGMAPRQRSNIGRGFSHLLAFRPPRLARNNMSIRHG